MSATSVFSEEVSLDEGLNTVKIGPVVRRVWPASDSAKPPQGCQRVYGHFGLSDSCLECHETDDSGRFTLSGEREEICVWCHGDLIRGRPGAPWASVHAPVRGGRSSQGQGAQNGLPGLSPEGGKRTSPDFGARTPREARGLASRGKGLCALPCASCIGRALTLVPQGQRRLHGLSQDVSLALVQRASGTVACGERAG
jgi:hypothetical protein